MKKTKKHGYLNLINENETFSCLDKITLYDFQIQQKIEESRMANGEVAGEHTAQVMDVKAHHTFTFRQSRVGSRTLYVKQIG